MQLVLGAPIIPLSVYILVAVSGFVSCGSQCPDIIVNLDVGLTTAWMMDASKIGLFVCLVVGIVIRNQTTRSTLAVILQQFGKCHSKKGLSKTSQYEFQTVDTQADLADTSSVELSTSSQSMVSPKSPPTSPSNSCTVVRGVFLTFANAILPALVAIMVKQHLVDYVEFAVGFIAPLFIVFFPCNIA